MIFQVSLICQSLGHVKQVKSSIIISTKSPNKNKGRKKIFYARKIVRNNYCLDRVMLFHIKDFTFVYNQKILNEPFRQKLLHLV